VHAQIALSRMRSKKMRISFFEEFPTPENLGKLELINFQTRIYIAARALSEFKRTKELLHRYELVYWPVLQKTEGYWFSPFSKRSALCRILEEVKDERIHLMLDLEHPIFAPWLYITQLPNFWRNKSFISNFIAERKEETTLVELTGNRHKLEFLGLSYKSEKVNKAKMAYTSLIRGTKKRKETYLQRICIDGVEEYGSRFRIGLGCIAKGISKLEPILTPEELARDLEIAKEYGVVEAIVYRLGGLNEKYIKAICE